MARHPKAADKVQDDAAAQDAITRAGYTSVTNLEHHGRVWTADAVDAAGAAVIVVVHGKDGRVNVDTDTD